MIVGIFVYLTGTFFFNILANYISKQEIIKYWHYTYIPDIIKNLMFSIATILYSKNISPEKIKQTRNIPNLDMI